MARFTSRDCFASDGDFNRVFDGSESTDKLYEGFTSLLERLGYWYERDTGRVYLYSVNPIINESFKKYFQWQWVCGLIKPDFNDVYHEMYEYLHRYPERMSELNWRKYEILIYEILRSQGFNVELGPGRGDGGIDIKMFQRDPIGDVLTAVQVKRYRPDRKITLQAVQALYGAATANDIQNSVFVTTSDYSPSAKKFAARENVSMKLYTSSDVRKWCNQAREGVIKNKALLISRRSVEKILDAAKKTPRQYVVHAHTGITNIMNSFAVILKESKYSALLMKLAKRIISHDGYEQRGQEVPVIDSSSLLNHRSETVFRAKKYCRQNEISFWTGRDSYSFWTERPEHYDLCD